MMQGNLAYLNPGGMQAQKSTALEINTSAAMGLQSVLSTNLGPRGTLKMLVSAGGQVNMSKDGNTLLADMQIQHPTAALIARAAAATDEASGDGTTSTVLLIGELMRLAAQNVHAGVHQRQLADGIDLARRESSRFLRSGTLAIPTVDASGNPRLDLLTQVARTALGTKVSEGEDKLAGIVTDAVNLIRTDSGGSGQSQQDIDLMRIEMIHMRHRLGTDTTLVRGLVLDHGGRHADMPSHLENCFIFTCNVSLEYDRSELSAGFYYTDAEQKKKMAATERKTVDKRVEDILELKRSVCPAGSHRSFVVINQKGVDPLALQMFAQEGILALRRAKRRNMERLVLSCGGEAVSSTAGLTPAVLGEAARVYEHQLGDDKFTFVEEGKFSKSCTILVRGPHDHTISRIKCAIRNGLRAVKNALDDGVVLPGGGATEVALSRHIRQFAEAEIEGKPRYGALVFADALLVIPKTLAANSGFDVIDSLLNLQATSHPRGLNVTTGDACDPQDRGILDNLCVKENLMEAASIISTQLLLVDELMKTGRRGK